MADKPDDDYINGWIAVAAIVLVAGLILSVALAPAWWIYSDDAHLVLGAWIGAICLLVLAKLGWTSP